MLTSIVTKQPFAVAAIGALHPYSVPLHELLPVATDWGWPYHADRFEELWNFHDYTTFRKDRQLTQTTLAERANTHVTQIRRYEAGTSTPPSTSSKTSHQRRHARLRPKRTRPPDDLKLIFEAINDLDPHHEQLAKELLEAITYRAHAR